MKKIISASVFLILFILGFSQTNQYGIAFITNYSPADYKGNEQNWSVTQDNRGVMYIGNNNVGLLEYDGVSWRKIPIDNESAIRSIATNESGNVFAGAISDFGTLCINKSGQYYYKSLATEIDSSQRDFSDIWNTNINDKGVFFGSDKYIFQFSDDSLKQYKISMGSVQSFNVNDTIYIPNFNKGLLTFSEGKTHLAKGGDFFIEKGVYSMNMFNNNILVGTYPQGLYLYNPKTGAINDCFKNKPANKFAQNYQLYNSCISDTSSFFIGTIGNGIILANTDGSIINHYNKSQGLQDETVVSLFKDKNQVIWLALYSGISKIEQKNALRLFNEKHGLNGSVVDICYFNNTLYVATAVGVFYKDNSQNFTQLKGINGAIWSILPIEDDNTKQVLIGTELGLYVADKNNNVTYIDENILPENINAKTNYIQKLYRSKKYPNNIYVATYEGVFIIEFRNNTWHFKTEIPVNNHDIRNIVEDKNGNIWLATYMNSVIKVSSNDMTDVTFFDNRNGPDNKNENCINLINDEVFVGTKKGLWRYVAESNQFIKDTILGFEQDGIYNFNQDNNGNIWISAFKDINTWLEQVIVNDQGVSKHIIKPFKRLPNEQFNVIFHDNNDRTWLGTSGGLYNYNDALEFDTNIVFHTLIRKVTSKADSVLFYGTYFEKTPDNKIIPSLNQPIELIPELSYYYNDLTFEFAAPYFVVEKKTQYSYKLEGFNDEWSKWNSETKAVFTNLGEGNYTFKAKAKNIYGIESTIGEYAFSIAPPWYRTILAYIIYTILSLGLIIVIVKLYTRRLEQEKIRLENIVQERTAEIRDKNKVLEKQKEEILGQKEEITASIHYAQRIQKAIVPNEELAETLLKNYFLLWKPRDIVSGDFWWLGEKDGYVVATAADCTGHGVPGAFMSMLGVSFLNEIVKQQSINNSGEILNRLRDKVKTTLGQTDQNSTSKDGMDMGLLVINYNSMTAQFSGAYNPLYLYRNGELIEYKATRNPIAIYIKEKPFVGNDIELQKGDTLYMFSDGYPDQFGGQQEKKYSTKRFKQYLVTIQKEPMEKQRDMLDAEIEDWMKDTSQIDDIIILGIRI